MFFFLIRLEELVMLFALIDKSCIGFIPCWGQKKIFSEVGCKKTTRNAVKVETLWRRKLEDFFAKANFWPTSWSTSFMRGPKGRRPWQQGLLTRFKPTLWKLEISFLAWATIFTILYETFHRGQLAPKFQMMAKMYCKKLFRGSTNHGFHWEEMLSPSRAP